MITIIYISISIHVFFCLIMSRFKSSFLVWNSIWSLVILIISSLRSLHGGPEKIVQFCDFMLSYTFLFFNLGVAAFLVDIFRSIAKFRGFY